MTATNDGHFRPIPRFPEYGIRADGAVIRLTPGATGRGSRAVRCGDLIVPQQKKNGYLQVGLWHGGKRHWVGVHRLVAETYIGPPPPGCHVNHKNFDRTHNDIRNLEYVTPAENVAHSVQAGRRSFSGENNPKGKLTAAQVSAIRGSQNRRNVDLAAEYGVHPGTISSIRTGKTWAT